MADWLTSTVFIRVSSTNIRFKIKLHDQKYTESFICIIWIKLYKNILKKSTKYPENRYFIEL